MNVYLTFDIEVWCNGWKDLDTVFRGHFERYVYGHSAYGDYALPKTLDILNKQGLHGIFFVEPLFAARFGIEYLETIVKLIVDAGQEVQLHIHPEWIDEISPPVLGVVGHKRQYMTQYNLSDQTRLIAFAKDLLESAGSGPISAFRSGSYAANRDTFAALQHNNILTDSSPNQCYPISVPDLRGIVNLNAPFKIDRVTSFPITVFTDGFGFHRPAQVGACGSGEMRHALRSAVRCGINDFTIISHNFEMLKPLSVQPDWIVVERFKKLSKYLNERRDLYSVGNYSMASSIDTHNRPSPHVPAWSTARRHIEQAIRRIY